MWQWVLFCFKHEHCFTTNDVLLLFPCCQGWGWLCFRSSISLFFFPDSKRCIMFIWLFMGRQDGHTLIVHSAVTKQFQDGWQVCFILVLLAVNLWFIKNRWMEWYELNYFHCREKLLFPKKYAFSIFSIILCGIQLWAVQRSGYWVI